MTQMSHSGQSRNKKTVINPLLYNALCRAAGMGVKHGFLNGVYISNQHMQNGHVYVVRGDKKYLNYSPAGEEYRVCCPFCGDTRHRLYINHEWGVFDPDYSVISGIKAHCFNAECQNTYPNFVEELQRRIDAGMLMNSVSPEYARNLSKSQLRFDGTLSPTDRQENMQMPGKMLALDMLPNNHKALNYLRSRNLDPLVMQNVFNVQFCFQSKNKMHSSRLVFPIYSEIDTSKLVGYTSRYVGDGDGIPPNKHIPKWLTASGFHRNNHLYNLERAIHAPCTDKFCVVVEGPTDVVNVLAPGGIAVAGPVVGMFGKYMAINQQKLLSKYWSNRDILFIPDPDVVASPKSAMRYFVDISKLRASGVFHSVSVATLPYDSDPGDIPDRELFWRWVQAMIEKGGNYDFTES